MINFKRLLMDKRNNTEKITDKNLNPLFLKYIRIRSDLKLQEPSVKNEIF